MVLARFWRAFGALLARFWRAFGALLAHFERHSLLAGFFLHLVLINISIANPELPLLCCFFIVHLRLLFFF
jgi:hypothetical protein